MAFQQGGGQLLALPPLRVAGFGAEVTKALRHGTAVRLHGLTQLQQRVAKLAQRETDEGHRVVLAAADMVSVFIRGSLVPLVTPDEKRGRVMAVENVFIGASNELGAFESGVAAQAFGTQTAVVGGGVATVGIVALYSVFFPTLRRVDRFEELETPENPR